MSVRHIAKARASLCATMANLLTFLRHPRLIPSRYQSAVPKITAVLWLFVLSLLTTAVLGVLTVPIMLSAAVAPSDKIQQVFTQPFPTVALAVILLGPLIEEIMFRGWLTGTWRSLAASGLYVATVFGGTPLMRHVLGGPEILRQLLLAGMGLVAIGLLAPVDRGGRVPGYERAFPFLFWAQGIAFGLLHYHNLGSGSAIASLMSILPLVACAWLWGYARIALGLRAAVMLHAAYNVPAVFGTIMMMHFAGKAA